jgi:DNA end-binding protein Ku
MLSSGSGFIPVTTGSLTVTVSFSGRENVVAIRAAGDGDTGGMMAYTLRYANELRSENEYFRDIKAVDVNAESLELAENLIVKKSTKLDLSKFEDGYEVAVKELVEAKIHHLPVPKDEGAEPSRGKVVNLMDALRKSIGTPETVSKKKPVASVKPETKKGIGLVKSPTKAPAKRKSAKQKEIGVRGDSLTHFSTNFARIYDERFQPYRRCRC